MDGQRFDRLTKALASGTSRRSVLKGLFGLSGAAVVSPLISDDAGARTSGSRPRPPILQEPTTTTTQTPVPTTPPPDPCAGFTTTCSMDGCCNGACTDGGRCCATGLTICGEDCCANEPQCCDGECCPDGTVCYDGQRCCAPGLLCGGVCCNGPGQRCCGDVCLEAGQCCDSGDCPASSGPCAVPACVDFACTELPATAGTLCRPSTGPCDPEELCTGLDTACHADALLPQGAVCRPSTGPCDPAEVCDGESPACPADEIVPGGAVCQGTGAHAGTALCCTGASPDCCLRGGQPSCIDASSQCCQPADCERLVGGERRCWFCRQGSCDAVDDGDPCRGTGTAGVCCDTECREGAVSCEPPTPTTVAPPPTTTTAAPATTTTAEPATTTTAEPGTTTTDVPGSTTTAGPTTTTRDPSCGTNTDCLSGEVCCSQVCRSGLCCDATDCLEFFPAACTGEDLDGGFVNLCACSTENQCGASACRTEAAACESDAQCCDGLECSGTLPGNAFCAPTCPDGCTDGLVCCDGVCQECCDADISTCPENNCGAYSCEAGSCQFSATVICQDPNFQSCFSRACDPATGGCVNVEYRGDGAGCGVFLSGNICCSEACIAGDADNCGGCGVACEDGFICFLGQCQCDADVDCPAGHHCCNSSCLPTDSDPQNCGGCGVPCPIGHICQGGQCRCNDDTDCPGEFDNLCRPGICDDNGVCQVSDTLCATTNPCQVSLGCNPDTGLCEFGPKCTGGLSCIAGQCLDCDCVIDGACYQNGDERPNNKCDHCDSSLSTTAWSPKTFCPASNIDCIVRFCDPSDGICYERVADPGTTCLTPHYYDDWQCANLNSETGICKGQACYFPDVSTFCNADPFDFCQFGFGTCQNGQCKATPQNENAACDFGTCSSGTCQNGDCVTFPINEGQDCSLADPPPCRNVDGLCSFGECITFPLDDGTICNTPAGACQGRVCQGGFCGQQAIPIRLGQPCSRGYTECLEGYVCNANGSCNSRTPADSFCDSTLAYCESQVVTPGICAGNGTCAAFARFESGVIVCDNFDDPDNIYPRECCPGMVCSEPPLCQGFCPHSLCYYPEDLPGGPIFP